MFHLGNPLSWYDTGEPLTFSQRDETSRRSPVRLPFPRTLSAPADPPLEPSTIVQFPVEIWRWAQKPVDTLDFRVWLDPANQL